MSIFATLKPLIIKSADIVTAYYEKMRENFDGLYVAESDFGTYTEETKQEILKTSTDITQAFTNIQTIETNLGTATDGLKSDIETIKSDHNGRLDEVERSVAETNAYVKTGFLYEDETTGHPVYGVEVSQMTEVDGEEVFNKCAQFTAGQITFFDKDEEVAYISSYRLFIREAEFTGNVKFGAFLLDTSKGFRLKWAGRG